MFATIKWLRNSLLGAAAKIDATLQLGENSVLIVTNGLATLAQLSAGR